MSSFGTLTPRQALENMIANDARNVREAKQYGATAPALVIADCAKRLFEARQFGTELERAAEANLRRALEGWR